MTLEIEINKRVDVIINGKTYKSLVQDVADNYIAIASPLMGGVYVPFHRGEAFTVVYYRAEREVYEFEGVVVGRKVEGRVQLVVLEYPKSFVQIQRREYVRVDISHPIKYVKCLLEAELKDANTILDNNNGSSGMMVDLSGGGMKLKTTEKMELNNFVTVEIDLNDKKIRAQGKLVRVIVDDNDNYVCGVLFVHMNERTRDRIIQLIFEIMRKQIKTS